MSEVIRGHQWSSVALTCLAEPCGPTTAIRLPARSGNILASFLRSTRPCRAASYCTCRCSVELMVVSSS